jgi:hypothetical protein
VERQFSFGSWMVENYTWSRVGLPAALLMLLLLPLLVTDDNRSMVLLVTLLPIYMIHQYEEHAHGRFAASINETIGKGHVVMSPLVIFAINIGTVWVLFVISFYLARFVAAGFAFIPVYLTLLNGLLHIGMLLRMRKYNPGLYTSIALFLPWGTFLLIYFEREVSHLLAFNLTGVIAGIVGHAGIVAYVLYRRSRIRLSIVSLNTE